MQKNGRPWIGSTVFYFNDISVVLILFNIINANVISVYLIN